MANGAIIGFHIIDACHIAHICAAIAWYVYSKGPWGWGKEINCVSLNKLYHILVPNSTHGYIKNQCA